MTLEERIKNIQGFSKMDVGSQQQLILSATRESVKELERAVSAIPALNDTINELAKRLEDERTARKNSDLALEEKLSRTSKPSKPGILKSILNKLLRR